MNVSGQLSSAMMHTASIGTHKYTVTNEKLLVWKDTCIIYFILCGCTLNSGRETTL